MQNPASKIVFVVRLSAIGDTLIAAKTILNLIASGYIPVFCTHQNCTDVVLSIPGLRYCALSNEKHEIAFYQIVKQSNEQMLLEPTTSKVLLDSVNSTSLTALDLQNTRRSKRFLRILKNIIKPARIETHTVHKRSLYRICLVAKSFFSRTQHARNTNNASGSLYILPQTIRRIANLNHSATRQAIGTEIQKTTTHIVPKSPRPELLLELLPQNFHNKNYVLICPGASLPLKSWGDENFAKLCLIISQQTDANIIIIGGKEELEMGNTIIQNIPVHRAVNLAGKLALGDSLTLLSKAQYVVSGDSFPGHACDLLGVPATILFGATSPHFGFTPEATNIRIRWLNLSCSPCTRHGRGKCRFKNRACLTNIKPEDVANDILDSLKKLP